MTGCGACNSVGRHLCPVHRPGGLADPAFPTWSSTPQVVAIGRVPCVRCPQVIELFAYTQQDLDNLEGNLAVAARDHAARHAREDTQHLNVEEAG